MPVYPKRHSPARPAQQGRNGFLAFEWQTVYCPHLRWVWQRRQIRQELSSFAFVASNTIDVVFNYVFVVLMNLGVAGSVYSTGLGAGVLVSAVLMAVLLIVPRWVCFAFGLRTEEELLLGISAIRIYALCVLPSGINMVMTYYYQAMEEEFASYLLFTLRNFVFYLAFSLLLGWAGIQWFWWLYPCTEVATMAALLLYGKKRGSLTLLDQEEEQVFSAFLYSRTANLGQVEQDVAAYMEKMEASPSQTYYASIVVEEVCGAIMNNAFFFGEGYIQFTIVPHEDKTVTIHVRDDARQFNPFDMDTDTISLEADAGLDAIGIKMIKHKAKEFFYRRYAGFNTLVVRV